MESDPYFSFIFQSLPFKNPPKEAFMNSDNEAEFSEIALSAGEGMHPPLDEGYATNPKPQRLFRKRNEPPIQQLQYQSNQFHSLPHQSHSNHGYGPMSSMLEANNLKEEITHGSHIRRMSSYIPLVQDSGSGSAQANMMDLNSISYNHNLDVTEEDSLNFELQEAEQDSLVQDYSSYDYNNHKQGDVDPEFQADSLTTLRKMDGQIVIPKDDQDKKKLIIPYNESFSSTNSIFTTSQDGSLDSCSKNRPTEDGEEDSLTAVNPANSLTLDMKPIHPIQNHHWNYMVDPYNNGIGIGVPLQQQTGCPRANPNQRQQPKIYSTNSQQPLIFGQDYQPTLPPKMRNGGSSHAPAVPARHVSNPDLFNDLAEPEVQQHPQLSPSRLQQQSQHNQQQQPSLMKMATERMKKKFLGWN